MCDLPDPKGLPLPESAPGSSEEQGPVAPDYRLPEAACEGEAGRGKSSLPAPLQPPERGPVLRQVVAQDRIPRRPRAL